MQSIATNEGFYRFQYGQGNGKLQQMSSPDGVISNMTYNGDFLQSLEQSGLGHGVLEFSYNNDHRLSSRRLNGHIISFSYDRDGLLTAAGPVSYRYSAENTLLKGTDVGASSTNLSHDVFGQLQSQATNVGGSSVYSLSVTRDQKGRVIEKSENILGVIQTKTFSYDSVGRLVGVTANGGNSVSYNYDSNGNRTSVDRGGVVANAIYNNQDQLLNYDGQQYQYSASGNLVSKQKGAALVEYNYDVFGNLQQVKLSDAKQITYLIDAQNRRVGRAVNGVPTHHWIYDSQLRVVGEMDGSGQQVSEFIYGSSQTPDVMIKNGVVYRIVQDHLGSPRLIVNSQSGSVLQRIDYDEFGRVLVDSNPGFQPFGFAGGLYDSETGLVRFGARDYDPDIGRWTSKDPIGFGGGDTNLYGYVLSNPVNFIDPTGTTCQMSQSSGVTICANMDGQIYMVNNNGYSGSGAGQNNPAMQSVPFQGPIPQGSYTVGAMIPKTPSGLLNALPLTPNAGTNTFGRDSFFIHGDNPNRPPGTSSSGCPIIGPANRNLIPPGEIFNVGQ